ncbi:phage tail tip protein J-related protein, partial [Escherichia coli]|uniref:phage tail tip protein J-related protein n=1 Tax=Escherichia coli TaxID=562 RepID=UPI0035CEC636
GHTYYVYVRTRNAFGVSDFVEASGKPTEDFDVITDYVTKDVMESEPLKEINNDIKDLGDPIDSVEGDNINLKQCKSEPKTYTKKKKKKKKKKEKKKKKKK